MMGLLACKPWEVIKQAKLIAELHKSIQVEVDFKLPQYKVNFLCNFQKSAILNITYDKNGALFYTTSAKIL